MRQTHMERTEQRLETAGAADRHHGALTMLLERAALDAARRLDDGDDAGPLAGATLAVKDLFDIRGLPTAAGTLAPPVESAPADAGAVARLAAAGMIPLAKARTVAFAFGTWGINRVDGTPRNPWDPAAHRVPGGSSSGSAVAVAAGLVDGALGTDTGGSVRIPAALNGITGLKPGFGRIGRSGLLPLSPSLDTVGPMARSVEMVASMFQALAGEDAGDPATAGAAPFDASAQPKWTARTPRIAVLGDAALSALSDPVGEAYLRALSDLEALGVRLVEARPPIPLSAFVEPTGLLIAHEAWTRWRDHCDRHGAAIDPAVLARLRSGEQVGSAQYARLIAGRRADQDRFRAWLDEFDLLLTPTVPITAPLLADADEDTLPFSLFTRAANWLDLPALALPSGFSPDGLPTSIQMLSPPGREDRVLALGRAYQARTDWHLRLPPMHGPERGATPRFESRA